MSMREAWMDVKHGRVQRICKPGKWRIWREGDEVRIELIGVNQCQPSIISR